MTRFKFWMIYLATIVGAAIVGGFIGVSMGNNGASMEELQLVTYQVGTVIGMLVLVPITWYRLGDAGKSRHWMWLYLVPIASLVPFLMAGFCKTKEI